MMRYEAFAPTILNLNTQGHKDGDSGTQHCLSVSSACHHYFTRSVRIRSAAQKAGRVGALRWMAYAGSAWFRPD